MFVTKKCVFREKLRCDALDIKVQNLVHKQDVCTIQKNNKCDDNRGDFVYHLVSWAFNTLGMVLRVCATYLLVIKNLKGFHDSLGI